MLPEVDVIVRCRNEMPNTRRTLLALQRQRSPKARVLFIDCRSTDGSRDAAIETGVQALIDLDPARYIPGAVLNMGMQRTVSPVVAFVNADAIPLDDLALGRLIEPLLEEPLTAATYGRQVARPDADPVTRLDYARAFARTGVLRVQNGTFFSMAGSAIRRDAWEKLPFDETLRYSEDVDWIVRARALGWRIAYVPEAEFEHSHAYDLRSHYRRRQGEGAADTSIHRLGPPRLWSDLVGPWGGCIVRDGRAGVLSPRSLLVRTAQAAGYFRGRQNAFPLREA
jgi:GT2 family glycosyltransferase